MIVPSGFILLGVIRDIQETNLVDSFVRSHFADHMKYIDAWDYVHGDSTNTLILKVYGTQIEDELTSDYQKSMASYGLTNTRLEVLPTSEIDLAKFQALEAQITGFETVAEQLTEARRTQQERDALVDSLQGTIDLIRGDTIAFNEIAKELKAIFPDLESCAFAKAQIADFESYRVEQPTLIVQWPANKTTRSRRTDESKISAFIAERLNMPVSLISR